MVTRDGRIPDIISGEGNMPPSIKALAWLYIVIFRWKATRKAIQKQKQDWTRLNTLDITGIYVYTYIYHNGQAYVEMLI